MQTQSSFKNAAMYTLVSEGKNLSRIHCQARKLSPDHSTLHVFNILKVKCTEWLRVFALQAATSDSRSTLYSTINWVTAEPTFLKRVYILSGGVPVELHRVRTFRKNLLILGEELKCSRVRRCLCSDKRKLLLVLGQSGMRSK